MDTVKLKRLSPYDTDSEKAALGSLLQSEKARIDIFSMLVASDFYHLSHQEIYKALECMHLAGELIDPSIYISFTPKEAEVVLTPKYILTLSSTLKLPVPL